MITFDNIDMGTLLSDLLEKCNCSISLSAMVDPIQMEAMRSIMSPEAVALWLGDDNFCCTVRRILENSMRMKPDELLRYIIREIELHLGQDRQESAKAPVAPTKRSCDDGTWGEYYGELDADGRRHGKGKMIWEDGVEYNGEWQNDLLHGWGTMSYANGDNYDGGWEIGKHLGWGLYRWNDGDLYEGDFKDGKRDGKGTFHYANGDKFVCGYEAGKRNGPGTYYFKDGFVRIHRYEDGLASREGVSWSDNRQSAWLLKNGRRDREINLVEARAIASQLGFSDVP